MYLVFICAVLLVGCTAKSETYEYNGESEHWEVVFKHSVDLLKNANNFYVDELVITYIGESEDIPLQSKIEYTYEIGSKTFSDTITFEEIKDSMMIKNGMKGNAPNTLQGDEVGILTISWNGQSERVVTK